MSEVGSRREAQLRVDRIRAFREELAALEREGVVPLSAGERERLERHLDETLATLGARFDVDTTESERRISWAMRIASTLGALALGAAVYLFFFRYWGLMSTPLQVALLVAAPLVGALATQAMAPRERTPYFTSLIALVAFAAFVLNLNVLGGIFNMTPSPAAFLAWSAFALWLAYQYRLRLLLAAGLGCAIILLAAIQASLAGAWWTSFIENPENLIPAGLLTIAAPSLVSHRTREEFPFVYHMLGLLVVFPCVLILSITASASYLPFSDRLVESIYAVTGQAGAGLVIWVGIRGRLAGVVNLGAAFFLLLLYARLFDWWWDWMPRYLFFLVIGLISIALLAVFRRIRSRVSARTP